MRMDRVNSVAELIERTKDMPLEKMRFFINEDKKEARCFGIYQEPDTGHWVVYKNKADGSRAVRYSGPDEGYAAQELWAKIQSEIELRRAKYSRKKKSRGEIIFERITALVLAAAVAAGLFFIVRWISRMPDRGYYLIEDALYYFQDDWYYYDDDAWLPYEDAGGYEWYGGNYYGAQYDGFEDAEDAFEYSQYYEAPAADDDNGDSNDDHDIFDSWDTGDTNWDSDW